jgi:hypothetical protein
MVVGERHRQTDRQGLLVQGGGGRNQDRPVALIGEDIGKMGPKALHQSGAAVEQDGCGVWWGFHDAKPDRAARSRGIGQIGGFAPFERFGQRPDAGRRFGNLEDQLANAKESTSGRSGKSRESRCNRVWNGGSSSLVAHHGPFNGYRSEGHGVVYPVEPSRLSLADCAVCTSPRIHRRSRQILRK